MSTPPRDQSALFHGGGRQPVREPKPGAVIWTLNKDALELRCELRDRGDQGCELQMLLNGELLSGKLYPSQEIAAIAADQGRAAALEQGWTA